VLILAHRFAWELCGILHRDVSGKNVLLTEDGRGVLNDWDLAKTINGMEKGVRRHQRTVSSDHNGNRSLLIYFA
jgi:RIO-like serine/threonine protein kinase